jgi:hypothetical protein
MLQCIIQPLTLHSNSAEFRQDHVLFMSDSRCFLPSYFGSNFICKLKSISSNKYVYLKLCVFRLPDRRMGCSFFENKNIAVIISTINIISNHNHRHHKGLDKNFDQFHIGQLDVWSLIKAAFDY